MKDYDYDIVIIGAGPAGIAAAIYAKRANLNCCMIEKEMPGGQVNKTSIVENYPGFTAIEGPDLVQEFYKQVQSLNIEIKFNEVTEIKNAEIKTIILKNGDEIKTRSIILALGRRPKKLDSKNYDRLEGKGISYCSLCDGNLYKGQDVSIIGSGNSALEESLRLANICSTVTVLVRSEKLKGDEVLIDRIEKKDNIKVLYNTTVEGFNEKDGILESITIKENNEEKDLKTKACFIFIGYEPATDIVKNLSILDKDGYVMVDEHYRTSEKGIYAAGDIVKKDIFQIVTSVSDGAKAAVTSIKDLSE